MLTGPTSMAPTTADSMHTRLLFLNQNVRSLTYDKEAELIRLMLAKGAFACTVQETHFNHDKQYVYGQHLVIGKEAMAGERGSPSYCLQQLAKLCEQLEATATAASCSLATA